MILFPKKKPIKDPGYLAQVRMLPCCVCYTPPPSHAHHQIGTKDKGMGMKVDDRRTMPLCGVCHQELHMLGHVTWESIYGKQKDHIERARKDINR